MNPGSANKLTAPPHYAFIFYRPATPTSREQVFYNEEAWSILSRSAASQNVKTDNIPTYISSLCLKWKEILERSPGEIPFSGGPNDKGTWHIAMLESHRRKYVVKGIALSGNPALKEGEKYLFIIDRVSPESANLSMVFRQYKLSNREQEIVRLLLLGNSNKEIAWDLGLSENTVKGYMKLLMGKLGVNNRAEIIAALLVGKSGTR